MTTNPETAPVCQFDEGCHRLAPCDPGCAVGAAELRRRIAVPDHTTHRERVVAAIKTSRFDELRTVDHSPNGPLQITIRVDDLADAVLSVLPPPADRATVLLEAAEALGRMDYDTDSNDYGYDTYRDAWNGGVMDAAEELRRLAAGPGADLIEDYLRFLRGQGPEPDLSGLAPVQREAVAGQFKIVRALADRDAELPPLDRDPVARRLGLAAVAQPELEAGAAATLARECTDHAAVILWCAERVRSVDDDPALQDAADHLHGLSTRAQVDATPVTERAAIIRWCAQEIHSMGGNSAVERAAEYLDDLATEAEEEPAAECSAQHRSLDDGRLCIRAAQHRGDHIDERGFHWSDTVAVYPVADGTFRTGVRQPDTETPDRAAVYQALADDYEQLIADGKFAGLQDVVTHLRGLAGGAGGVAGETAGETGEGGRAVGYRSAGGRALRCLQHRPSDDAFANGDFYPVTSEDLPDGGVCTFPVTVDERCGVDVLIPQEADHG